MADWPTLLWAPGDLKTSAAASPPPGWVLCDGSAYSRAAFGALFSAISTVYGNGDGSTTFNVPDYRGRVIVGAGTGVGLTARARGQTGGEEKHLLVTSEMPTHHHNINMNINGYAGGASASAFFGNDVFGPSHPSYDGPVQSAGGSTSHNVMQPYGVANVFIKT